MLPDFTSDGVLPRGVHGSTIEQFEERFVVFDKSNRRIRVFEKLKHLFDDAKRSGIVKRMIVAGSFVTAKSEPNDFDCILVLDATIVGKELAPFQYNVASHKAARRRYGGDVLCAVEGSAAVQRYLEFFQTARDGGPTGVVEIEI